MSSVDSKESTITELKAQNNMDHVNQVRDFTKVSWCDLEVAFEKLRLRCPGTWKPELQKHAEDFHRRILLLKSINAAEYIDPEIWPEDKTKYQAEIHAEDLIISPSLWNMYSIAAALALQKVLHHFTIHVPFAGRPFVRLWLEALVPCFSRWILLSDKAGKIMKSTLQNFLGAFGQPGIIVCLADKGEKLLNTLKHSARSVEAVGRGTVERYYWKRLAESSCGKEKYWRELASIRNINLEKSQLDTLPKNWLLDSTDFVHVFANILSPAVTNGFRKRMEEIFSGRNIKVEEGPPKTLARSIAKCIKYKSQYDDDNKDDKSSSKNHKRWGNFRKRFMEIYERPPQNAADFVWNIVDFARCSIIVPDARELLKVKKLLEEHFKIVCVKNGYNSDISVKGSGYRDVKLLVEVEFDGLDLRNIPQVGGKIKLICEIQLVCEKWLKNKKTTSLSYKVQRATKLQYLLNDFAKYLNTRSKEDELVQMDIETIIKDGRRNLARIINFAEINCDKLLLDACNHRWDPTGIDILVKKGRANLETSLYDGRTPIAIAAGHGYDKILATLIRLKSNIDAQNNYGMTPLHYASSQNRVECARLLVKAGCSQTIRDKKDETALDRAKRFDKPLITELLQGGSPPKISKNTDQLRTIKRAAREGSLSLANYFDNNLVECSIVENLLTLKEVAASMANILQVLWFGGQLEQKGEIGWTALGQSVRYGDLASVNVLLELGADTNALGNMYGSSPLHRAIKHGTVETAKALINAKADIDLKNCKGFTPLHSACRDTLTKFVIVLLDARADVMAETNDGNKAIDLILNADSPSEEQIAVRELLLAAMQKSSKMELLNLAIV